MPRMALLLAPLWLLGMAGCASSPAPLKACVPVSIPYPEFQRFELDAYYLTPPAMVDPPAGAFTQARFGESAVAAVTVLGQCRRQVEWIAKAVNDWNADVPRRNAEAKDAMEKGVP